MAVHHGDVIALLQNYFENDETAIIKFIDKYQGNINLVTNMILSCQDNADIPDADVFVAISRHLPEYMYKLDYKTSLKRLPSQFGQTPVYLTKADVQRTSTVQGYYRYGNTIGD